MRVSQAFTHTIMSKLKTRPRFRCIGFSLSMDSQDRGLIYKGFGQNVGICALKMIRAFSSCFIANIFNTDTESLKH